MSENRYIYPRIDFLETVTVSLLISTKGSAWAGVIFGTPGTTYLALRHHWVFTRFSAFECPIIAFECPIIATCHPMIVNLL